MDLAALKPWLILAAGLALLGLQRWFSIRFGLGGAGLPFSHTRANARAAIRKVTQTRQPTGANSAARRRRVREGLKKE